MRTIGVITSARSDYGIYRPLLEEIEASPTLSLQLIVTGMHLLRSFGQTVRQIEADGFPISARVPMPMPDDTPQATVEAGAEVQCGLARLFAEQSPDLLVVLGDRFEMHAAACAAVPFNIPLAHLHGGELTEGAIDDVLRHALTKMAHLHFVSTETYTRRVIQLGEQPDRVFVTGALGLDSVHRVRSLDRNELHQRLGTELPARFLLMTFHPETRHPGEASTHIKEVISALEKMDWPTIVTYPNTDPGHQAIIHAIETFATRHPDVHLFPDLGTTVYLNLMRRASAMVGNSSSGIIEAASYALPVVNVGNRQAGRVRGKNVIDAPLAANPITHAIEKALSPSFRLPLADLANPYGDGHAAPRIRKVLETVMISPALLAKRFHDQPMETAV